MLIFQSNLTIETLIEQSRMSSNSKNEIVLELTELLIQLHRRDQFVGVMHPRLLKRNNNKIMYQRESLTEDEEGLFSAPEKFHVLKSYKSGQSDLYSLGIFMYYLYGGKYPIKLAQNESWFDAHIKTDVKSIEHLDHHLNAIILKLLNKNPQQRYKSALGLLYELKYVFSENEVDHDFIPGAIDDQLQIIDALDYPLMPHAYDLFNSFIQQDILTSSIFVIGGQSSTLCAEVLLKLSSQINKGQHYIYYIELQRKDSLKQLIEQYIAVIFSFSLHKTVEISNALNDAFAKNMTRLTHHFNELSKLININEHLSNKVINDHHITYENVAEEQQEFTKLLTIMHSFMDRPVIWIANGEDVTNVDDAEQAEFISSLSMTLPTAIKLILSSSNGALLLEGQAATRLTLEPLTFDDIRRLLSSIMQEDSEQLRILAQTLLYTCEGDFVKLKSQLLAWKKNNLIYYNEATYSWCWSNTLIENQGYTNQLIDDIMQKVKALDAPVLEVIAVSALIDSRVNARLLAEVCGHSPLYIKEAMNYAERLGIVFYNKAIPEQAHLSEYVFLNTELRFSLQQLAEPSRLNWHLKIAQTISKSYMSILANSNRLHMNHLFSSHSLLDESERSQLVEQLLTYGIDSINKHEYIDARQYLLSGMQLCECYKDKYSHLYYRYILYLAVMEYVCENYSQSEQLFAQLETHKSQLTLDELRYFYMWQMEIKVDKDEELAYKLGIKALSLYDLKITNRVSLVVLIKEIIATQRLLKKYRSGLLTNQNINSEQFIMMCRTVYGISGRVGNTNPLGLIYFYTKFIQDNLRVGMNNDFALIISMYELLLQRGAPQLFKLFPSDTFNFILEKEQYSSYHFYVIKAILSQIDQPREVFPLQTAALTQAVESNDYRHINLILISYIVLFDEEIDKIQIIFDFIKNKIHISLDIRVQQLIDELVAYYDANQSKEQLYEYINVDYDLSTNHINYISMNRMEMSYLAKDYKRVLHWYTLASQTMLDVNWIQNRKILFFKHLAEIALFYGSHSSKEKSSYISKIKKYIKKMKSWHGYYGVNTSAYYIVCAEYEAMLGHVVQAQSLYEKAIKNAREEKNRRIEAIALDCLSQFFTRRGSETGKKIALTDAIAAYSRSGSQSKVELLSSHSHIAVQQSIINEQADQVEHQLYETTTDDIVNVALISNGYHLNELSSQKGHWDNNVLFNSFITIACRQVTSEFGLIIEYEQAKSRMVSSYGKSKLIENDRELTSIINYCANTLNTYIYNVDEQQCLQPRFEDLHVQSLICIPMKLVNRKSLYLLVIGSHLFDQLFTAKEKLVLEMFLSRFMYLVEQSQVTSNQLTSYLQTSVQAEVFSTLLEPLTERELDVLREIVNGLSNDEISKALNIKLATVKTHINNIYSKLGVRRRAQAILRAKEMKLV